MPARSTARPSSSTRRSRSRPRGRRSRGSAAEKLWANPIVTEVVPASTFWQAEDYHQEYFERVGSRNPVLHDGGGTQGRQVPQALRRAPEGEGVKGSRAICPTFVTSGRSTLAARGRTPRSWRFDREKHDMRNAASAAAFAMFLAVQGPAWAVPPTIGGCPVFPANNYWNTPVDTLPVHPSSASVGGTHRATPRKLHPDWGNVLADNYGIPFVTVTGSAAAGAHRARPGGGLRRRKRSGPLPDPAQRAHRGRPGERGRPARDRGRDGRTAVLYELYHATPLNGGASWSASSFGEVRPQFERAAPRGLDLRRRRGPADLPGARALGGSGRGRDRARHPLHRRADLGARRGDQPATSTSGRRGTGRATSTDQHAPADGRALSPQGVVRHLAVFRAHAGDPARLQEVRSRSRRRGQQLVLPGRLEHHWPDSVFSELKTIAGSQLRGGGHLAPHGGREQRPSRDSGPGKPAAPGQHLHARPGADRRRRDDRRLRDRRLGVEDGAHPRARSVDDPGRGDGRAGRSDDDAGEPGDERDHRHQRQLGQRVQRGGDHGDRQGADECARVGDPHLARAGRLHGGRERREQRRRRGHRRGVRDRRPADTAVEHLDARAGADGQQRDDRRLRHRRHRAADRC